MSLRSFSKLNVWNTYLPTDNTSPSYIKQRCGASLSVEVEPFLLDKEINVGLGAYSLGLGPIHGIQFGTDLYDKAIQM